MVEEAELYAVGAREDWTDVESSHSRTGALPKARDINAQVYLAQISEFDARKAEALLLDAAADPLLLIRSLLFRGRFKEAHRFIAKYKNEFGDASAVQYLKVLIEEARLAAFEGQWPLCQALCEQANSQKLPAITRLTAFQIAALAYFELGDMAKAKAKLELVDSMSRLFPKSISSFYAELLSIRIEARDEGVSWASARLAKAWRQWVDTGGDVNQFQTLLRTEVDIKRLSLEPHFNFALGSYLAAEVMGEELYVALALLDCSLASNAENRSWFASKIKEKSESYVRVKRILDEINGKMKRSATTETIIQYLALAKHTEAGVQVGAAGFHAGTVILPQYEVMVTLNPFKILSLKKYPQFIKVFQAVSAEPVSKSDFFRSIWGNQKYAPAIHDSLIYALLYRIGKSCGVKINIRGKMVCLENALVIY